MITVNGKRVKKDDNVTKDFKYREFASKDGAATMKLDIKAVQKLQQLRDGLNSPIIINSAYRSPSHNRNVGGATNSRHLYGDAFDIRIPGYTPLEVANYAKGLGFTGVSAYNTFTHVDTRPGGFVSWGANRNRIKSKKLPDRPKKNNKNKEDFVFESDILKFEVDNKIIETIGVRRFLKDSNKFLQYIAVRDLEALGFDVRWTGKYTEIIKTNQYRPSNLNLRWKTDNVSHALVYLKYKNQQLELEGHVIYDIHKNTTQFIAVKDLKGLGFNVEWDSNRRLVKLS